MRATILPSSIIPTILPVYTGHGVYCGLSTASVVFLMFMHFVHIVTRRGALQQEYSPSPILSPSHFMWVVIRLGK